MQSHDMCRRKSTLKCPGYRAKRGGFVRFNLRTLSVTKLAEGSAEVMGNSVNCERWVSA